MVRKLKVIKVSRSTNNWQAKVLTFLEIRNFEIENFFVFFRGYFFKKLKNFQPCMVLTGVDTGVDTGDLAFQKPKCVWPSASWLKCVPTRWETRAVPNNIPRPKYTFRFLNRDLNLPQCKSGQSPGSSEYLRKNFFPMGRKVWCIDWNQVVWWKVKIKN